jgi:hypothetical protein
MNRLSTRLLIVAVAALLSVGVTAGISAATATSQPSKFYGCENAKANVEDISTWSGLKCPSGLTEVSWSAKGSAGRKGAQGLQGVQGPQGAQGSQGPAGAPAVNPTVLYDSMTVSSNYQWSYAFDATGANQLGNDITLANGGGSVKTVTVSMGNFGAASASQPLAITFTIYNQNAVDEPGNGVFPGSVIAAKTVTITPPGTVSGCGATYTPGCIDNFNVTFNFGGVTVPDDVVYGISYNNTSVDTGLNVNLSYESSSVPSAGVDTFPGWIFVATLNGQNGATGGSGGEITCQNVSGTFAQYTTAPDAFGESSCGLDTAPIAPGLLVPAVELSTAA